MLLCCRFPLPTLAERRVKVQLQPDRGGTIGQIPSAAAAAIALALLRLALVFAFFGAWQRCGWVAGHKTPPQSSQAQGQWAYVNVLHGRQSSGSAGGRAHCCSSRTVVFVPMVIGN